MKNRFFAGALSILLALALVSGVLILPAFAAEGDFYTYAVKYDQTDARSIFKNINELRTGNNAWYWNADNTTKTICSNLSPLKYDYGLEKVAMQRAAELVASYSHTRPNGERCFTAYTIQSSAAENIAYGFKTAASVQNAWEEADDKYADQGHRRNMLGASYVSVGIACAEYNGIKFWVQEFSGGIISETETAANNESTYVNVQIADSYIKSKSLLLTYDNYTSKKEESIRLPDAIISLEMTTGIGKILTKPVSANWSSSDTSVAKIEGNKIIAVGTGTAIITATAEGKTSKVTITVVDKNENPEPEKPETPETPVTPEDPNDPIEYSSILTSLISILSSVITFFVYLFNLISKLF